MILFKTENGKDYLNQLAAMKATVVVPQPKDWTGLKAYPLTTLPPTGEDFRREDLPGLYFIDDSSAGNLTRAMGLGFDAPMFIAFFPAEIEERMASLEREFRKRQESEIFETKFKVLLRDGKPEITVVEQVPVSR